MNHVYLGNNIISLKLDDQQKMLIKLSMLAIKLEFGYNYNIPVTITYIPIYVNNIIEV